MKGRDKNIFIFLLDIPLLNWSGVNFINYGTINLYMDKKFLGLILVAILVIAFQRQIKAYLATLNPVQKLMLGQMLLLSGILILLLYYIFSRSEE